MSRIECGLGWTGKSRVEAIIPEMGAAWRAAATHLPVVLRSPAGLVVRARWWWSAVGLLVWEGSDHLDAVDIVEVEFKAPRVVREVRPRRTPCAFGRGLVQDLARHRMVMWPVSFGSARKRSWYDR